MTFLTGALSILGETGSNEQNLRKLEPCTDKLVPFVGAGLSAVFNYPGWKPFLQAMAEENELRSSVDELLSRDQYEEAAETLERHLHEKFNDIIRTTFDHERLTRQALRESAVRHLPKIARGPVLTTNFDKVLEAAFDDAGRGFTATFPGSQIADANRAIQLRERVLLKLHGDYMFPFSRVLTLSEYGRAYGATVPGQIRWELPLPQVLRQAIVANPLLFLGCSLNADRTTAIIAQVAEENPGLVHFALLSETANTPGRLAQLERWRVRPSSFRPDASKR